MKKKSNPVINFKGYKIKELKYYTDDNIPYDIEKDKKYKLKGQFAYDMESKEGILVQTISLYNEDEFYICAEVQAMFDLDDSLSEKEVKQYLSVNGSAMLYPYIRTIFSMVTALDNSRNVVLPSLNFSEFLKKDVKINN